MAAKRRVLIVEDDPLIASAVAMIVETELAYESVTAHSIAKAADLIDARTITTVSSKTLNVVKIHSGVPGEGILKPSTPKLGSILSM